MTERSPLDPDPDPGAEVIPFPGINRDALRPDTSVPDGSLRKLLLRDVIGEVLRNERHDQGRTLAEVAEEAAVSVQYLSEVERGRKEVSSDLLSAMHDALGLDLTDVLDRALHRSRVRADDRGPSLLAA